MQIYYINLSSQPGRKDAMEAQLAALGLAATRIEATTPADITAEDEQRYCNPRRYHWLTVPELACNYSHMEAFRRIAAGPDAYGLVLEDDVLLSRALPNFIAAYERARPAIDLLKIDVGPMALRVSTQPAEEIGGVALRRVLSNAPGSGATIVSRRAAAMLIASPELLRLQVDTAVYDPYRPLPRRLAVRHADPGLAAHPEFFIAGWQSTSTLLPARRFREDAPLSPLARLLRRVRVFYDRDIRMGIPKTWRQLIGGAEKRVVPYRPE
jgi:GR25 family glycosyltransferase involved in LPS biosynthesis